MNCQRDFSDIPIPRGIPDSQRYLNQCLSKYGENILVLIADFMQPRQKTKITKFTLFKMKKTPSTFPLLLK